MKPTPIISNEDMFLLREIRRLAAEVSDCASLLYWETQYPDTIRARFDAALHGLSVLLPTAQASFAPATRTRYSWDGATVTSHVESV
jgi:hypothetical protein